MKFKYYVKLTVCVCVITFATSCNSEKRDTEKVLNNAKVVSSTIIPHEFLLGKPYQIAISKNILFIADTHDDKALILYDVKSKVFLGNQLRIGQGPNEVIPPLLLGRSSEDDALSVLQRRSGKYAIYKPADLAQGIIEPRDTLTFHNTDRLAQTSNGYIAEGEYQKGAIQLLDSSGKSVHEIDIYPSYIQKLKSIADKYIYGQGHIAFNNQSKVLAFAAYFTGEVLFYQLDGNNSFKRLQNYDFSLSSKLKNRINSKPTNARIGDTDIEYFADIFSTSDYFYLLYTGVPMKERHSAAFSYVFKFSSKGKFIESYKTDIKLQSMCVNEGGTKIYGLGLSKDFEYVLVEIDI